ncbi:MAG: trigger factor [Phycisphaerae bacterium]|nr:trigger factor [Phycisphaerae bacterium]
MSDETKPQDETTAETQSQETAPTQEQPQEQGSIVSADTSMASNDMLEAEKPFAVDVTDAGALRKKVTITVPRKRINEKFNEIFGELAKSAQVPGFRAGHAPRRLIEKRFAKDAGTDVRNAMVGESLQWSAEHVKLQTIGEPSIDLEAIVLPDNGDMSYSFEIEVAPEFELPSLDGIEVKKVTLDVTDQRVEEQLDMFRQRGVTYEPTTEATRAGDVVTADVAIRGDGVEYDQKDAVMRVAPGQVEGLPLVDLATQLADKKPGDSIEVGVKVPESHATEAWRGKDATVAITVREVRRRILPELNDEFAKQMGYDTVEDLRNLVRRGLSARMEQETTENMREQVSQYLLENAQFELPEQMAARHADVALRRQFINLLQMGIPQEKIQENLAELQARSIEVSRRELKLQFILGKIADQRDIKVEEGEVNARVAAMAREQDRRPERLRQELQADGTLGMLEDRIREEKALNALLEKATITEVEPEAKPAE